MAYNVIKGNVEFSGPVQGTIEDMVDDHTDQTIAGTKTFTQMVTASAGLSASVFYGDGSGLSGITSSPIDTYDNSGDNRILTSVDSTTIQGEANLTFDGTSLSVTGDVTASANVSASAFQGDGNSLTNIGPSSLNYGNGLRDLANNLELNLDTSSGLQVGVGGLKVYPSTLAAASALGDTDLFITDQSGNKKATALQIYNYVDGKLTIPTVAGADGQIQFNDAGDLGASSNLAFNSSTGLLTTVSGNFQTLEVEGQAGQSTILTLDKGENSASYVEFRNGGTKYAEIFGTSAESFFIRTTSTSSTFALRQINDNLLTFVGGTTTFDTNPVTVNQDMEVTGTLSSASRIHGTTVQTGSYSIGNGDEIILMNNSAGATASLPPISSDLVGLTVTIKRTGTGAVQVSGSDGIDTQSTIDITPQGGFMRVVAADFGGSNYGWAIIAKSGSF